MELMSDRKFWEGRKVFLTGHTGFKGAWMSIWLHGLGARVTGYSMEPPTKPNLFEDARVEGLLERSHLADVRDLGALRSAMEEAAPEIVIHMAAQSLVRRSYRSPVETYEVNVMGTVNVLEAVRMTGGVRAVINVTSDKCYANRERLEGYREEEPMGGHDPYSSSKGCSELVTSAYRESFFSTDGFNEHGVALASARAGNVIGGGDWAEDRLLPDCLRAVLAGRPIQIRNPGAIRPWQHVLEPVGGYLLLARKLFESGPGYAGAWNFGPNAESEVPVDYIVSKVIDMLGYSEYEKQPGEHPHEAGYLKLDSSKSRKLLGWKPRWDLDTAIARIIEYMKAHIAKRDLLELCQEQIRQYEAV